MYLYCICNISSLPPPPPLSVSQCAVGCCRPCRGDLLPCCTELCWWRRRVRCQGQLSDKQSRCLTLTNSPAGQPPRQSFRRYIKSKCWDSQLLQQRLRALPLTTTASSQSTPTSHSLSFVCGELRPLSPDTAALHMIVFGHRGYCEYADCVFLHNRTQLSKLTQAFRCPLPVQSLVLLLAPPVKLFEPDCGEWCTCSLTLRGRFYIHCWGWTFSLCLLKISFVNTGLWAWFMTSQTF